MLTTTSDDMDAIDGQPGATLPRRVLMKRVFRTSTVRAVAMTRRRGGLVVVAGLWLGVAGATPAQAAPHDDGDVRVTATVDGRDLTDVGPNNALRLNAEQETVVSVEVENLGDEELVVRSLRIDGKVIGLTFFSYETRIDLRVDPGESGDREFVLDLIDLGSQANGLLPARLALFDQDRDLITTQSFPADVRGSFGSVYNVFGLIIAAITAVLFITAVIALTTQRLSANRWRRGVRFGLPGLGLGLTLTFTLSTLRVLTPSATWSGALVVILGAALLVVGYFTPTPEPHDDESGGNDDGGFSAADHAPQPPAMSAPAPPPFAGPGGGPVEGAGAREEGNVMVRGDEPVPPSHP